MEHTGMIITVGSWLAALGLLLWHLFIFNKLLLNSITVD